MVRAILIACSPWLAFLLVLHIGGLGVGALQPGAASLWAAF